MLRFDWDDSLALGITALDDQHRTWIERLNSLSDAIESNQEDQHISKTLKFLVGYSEFHFAAEEKLMAAHDYPLLEQHKQEHKKYRDALADLLLLQIGQADALSKISDSVKNFQIAWLTNHIRKVDRKFADFLDENVAVDMPDSL